MKKRICWITAHYMTQVDLPIIRSISDNFDVDWYLWGNESNPSIMNAINYAKDNGINYKVVNTKRHSLHPFSIIDEYKIIKTIRDNGYDAYYLDISLFPWLLPVVKAVLPKEKVIIAMHHGKIHSGMRFKPLYRPFLKYLNGCDYVLQYFSKNQAEGFSGKNEKLKYIIPLALNCFGSSSIFPPDNKVVFTVFGNIIPSKNIPLLIDAANKLYELRPGKFKVQIVGHCRSWAEVYQPLIKYPEAFRLDIRRIDENEIPDLFGSTHYLVLPYKSVTQSGPLRIAYGYNTPVIASDLEGFKESVEEGITGILFKTEDVDSLVEKMLKVIDKHPYAYSDIKKKQKKYIEDNFSTDKICAQYIDMINSIVNR